MNRVRAQLALFVADVFASVPRKDQRAKSDCYLRGLMTDGRRKSVQAMASRLPDGNEQNLQQFVNQSTWDPVPVRRRIAQRMVPRIGPDAWAVDDVSFPKDGRMSVGVAPQYCGALGKQANCQVAVSVHAVSDTASCPLDWRLFLPREWADDTLRRGRTGVPRDVGHREKWRLALDVIDELAGWGLTPPVLVADAGYGQNADFRDGLDGRGIGYVVAVRSDVSVHPQDARPVTPPWSGTGRKPQPRYRDKPLPVAAPAASRGRQAFTEVTWRQGSRGPTRSHFLALEAVVEPGVSFEFLLFRHGFGRFEGWSRRSVSAGSSRGARWRRCWGCWRHGNRPLASGWRACGRRRPVRLRRWRPPRLSWTGE